MAGNEHGTCSHKSIILSFWSTRKWSVVNFAPEKMAKKGPGKLWFQIGRYGMYVGEGEEESGEPEESGEDTGFTTTGGKLKFFLVLVK